MKNKVFLTTFLLIYFFISCQLKSSTTSKVSITQKVESKIELKRELNERCYYLLSINNNLCKHQDTILSISLKEEQSHHIEFIEKAKVNILFYEYSSVRPVYSKTIFFRKDNTTVDSVQEATFNFSTLDFELTSSEIKKPICDYNLQELIPQAVGNISQLATNK